MSLLKYFPKFVRLGAVVRLARRAYYPYRSQIAFLTALGFAGGILEGIGINAVIPLLTFVLGLHDAASDTLSKLIQGFFAFLNVPFVPKYLLTFIVVLFVVKTIVSIALSYIQIRITTQYERDTRSKLFGIVLNASWPFLLKQKLGNLEAALMIDTPASTSLLWKISATITLLTSLAMYVIVAFSISAVVTIVTIVLGILVFAFLRPLMDRVHALSRERAAVYRDTLHHVTEHVGGIKTVKALGTESAAIASAEVLFASIKERSTKIQILQQFGTQIITPVGILYIALIFGLAYKSPFINFAALPAILYLIYRIFTYIQQMQNNAQSMSELAPHLERVVFAVENAGNGRETPSGTLPFAFERDLAFEHVTFAYEKSRTILHDVSFTIAKGSMVGIVGPSGAGKTTTVDLMLRLLNPTSGAITLDGVQSTDIELSEWRSHVGYVSQDFFIIHDTIRNNIRFYDESMTDDAIWEAARLAHIDNFIRKLPAGLDTEVGERGISLSAGERQRIVIARALARKPQLLILDEATSSLDNESEAHIKRVIEELKGRVTIVAIAHRLSTIMGSDHLVVLQDGRVVEEGSPKKLLAHPDSYFYKVYTISQ